MFLSSKGCFSFNHKSAIGALLTRLLIYTMKACLLVCCRNHTSRQMRKGWLPQKAPCCESHLGIWVVPSLFGDQFREPNVPFCWHQASNLGSFIDHNCVTALNKVSQNQKKDVSKPSNCDELQKRSCPGTPFLSPTEQPGSRFDCNALALESPPVVLNAASKFPKYCMP